MTTFKELQDGIARLEQHLSLLQVAKQSGVNYITLRNIKFGKSSRVTEAVASRLGAFITKFKPDGTGQKAVVKKDAADAGAKAAAPKGGKGKAGTGAAVGKPASPGKRAAKQPATAPKAPSPAAHPAQAAGGGSMVLGDALKKEIEIIEARLSYLRTLQRAEAEYQAALAKK